MMIKKYWTTFVISFRNTVFYGKNVIGGTLIFMMFIFVFFNLWNVIFKDNTISGYTFAQMIWYICIAELIVTSMRSSVYYEIGQEIKSGSIAYQLGRPYHYIFYQFANCMGGVVVNFLMYSLIAFVLGTLLVGVPPVDNLMMLPWFLLSTLLSMALQFFIMITIGLVAFYVEENRPFFFIYSKLILLLGTFVPIEFYPDWVQKALQYLPISFVAWAPAKMFVNFSISHALIVIPIQAFWIAVFVAISMAIYSKGVKSINAHGG